MVEVCFWLLILLMWMGLVVIVFMGSVRDMVIVSVLSKVGNSERWNWGEDWGFVVFMLGFFFGDV